VKGWVNRLSCRVHPQKDFSLLGVQLDMTPSGIQFLDEIVRTILDYIKMLQNCSNLEEQFAEVMKKCMFLNIKMQTISWLAFNYSTQENPLYFVNRVSSAMQVMRK
jgi:secreted Zn-dependent insulinase-like peptidase